MSKAHILNSIRINKPQALSSLPDIPAFGDTPMTILDTFKHSARNNKITVHDSAENIQTLIQSNFGDATHIWSSLPEFPGTVSVTVAEDPHELDNVDLVILKAPLAVAENGAIWLDTRLLAQRVLPFITQHLLIVVQSNAIVPKMHQAYARLDPKEFGYGVFIAGPSKTADIEQTLVIGAHGPLSMHILINNDL